MKKCATTHKDAFIFPAIIIALCAYYVTIGDDVTHAYYVVIDNFYSIVKNSLTNLHTSLNNFVTIALQ